MPPEGRQDLQFGIHNENGLARPSLGPLDKATQAGCKRTSDDVLTPVCGCKDEITSEKFWEGGNPKGFQPGYGDKESPTEDA